MSHLSRLSLFLSILLLAGAAQSQSPVVPAGSASAVFGGGCFWCMEADFEKLPGVIAVDSGYAGGKLVNPTYEQVSAGNSGHLEVVKVVYDPAKVSYPALLDYYWHHIDPTVGDRQFCDVGNQYRSAIFVENDAQRAAVDTSKIAILKAGVIKKIYTETLPLTKFYPAEDYHQDYYKKNPVRYAYYRHGCGRDARVAEVWGTAKH